VVCPPWDAISDTIIACFLQSDAIDCHSVDPEKGSIEVVGSDGIRYALSSKGRFSGGYSEMTEAIDTSAELQFPEMTTERYVRFRTSRSSKGIPDTSGVPYPK